MTLQKLLDNLPFDPDGLVAVNAHFRHSLEEAVDLYTESREEALDRLYKDQSLNKNRSQEYHADLEEVAASCGYFSFCLLDFANEMKNYLEILDDLKLEIEERPGGRSWNWIKFWRTFSKARSRQTSGDPGRYHLASKTTAAKGFLICLTILASNQQHTESFEANMFLAIELESLLAQDEEIFDTPIKGQSKTTPDRHQTSQDTDSFRYRLWKALGIFRREDVKFAIKVGAGAAVSNFSSQMFRFKCARRKASISR